MTAGGGLVMVVTSGGFVYKEEEIPTSKIFGTYFDFTSTFIKQLLQAIPLIKQQLKDIF